MTTTSVNLLNRLREPNAESAWQRFIELYTPLIFYWGRQRGLSVDEASELVQDVLLTLIVKLREFEYDPSQKFRAWLRTITFNRAIDHRRKMMLRPKPVSDLTLSMIPSNDDLLLSDTEYRQQLVLRALELLRADFEESTWQAGWQQLVEGKKASLVAKDMKMSLNSVYLAKSRLLARLRLELDGLLE